MSDVWIDPDGLGGVAEVLARSAEEVGEIRSSLIDQATVVDLRGGGDPTFAAQRVDDRLAEALVELMAAIDTFEDSAGLIGRVVEEATAADAAGPAAIGTVLGLGWGNPQEAVDLVAGGADWARSAWWGEVQRQRELLRDGAAWTRDRAADGVEWGRDQYERVEAEVESAKAAFPGAWNDAVDTSTPFLVRGALGAADEVQETIGLGMDVGETAWWLSHPTNMAVSPPSWMSPGQQEPDGDLGGTYESRSIVDYTGATAATPTERGREALTYLLSETHGDSQHHRDDVPKQIRDDEFELMQHDDSTYTVVLPGVVDLSDPTKGLNPIHRTSRSMYMYAVESLAGADKADNRYAVTVERSLEKQGVPKGASIMLVGHSYGSDSAFDLAADPAFNRRYNVTHVLGAGYYNQEQLEHIPAATNVLALENDRDVPVMVESIRDRITFDSPTKNDHEHTLIVFDGDTKGVGHHPDNYTDYLMGTDDPRVTAFFESVDAAGYTTAGEANAIDVSVPLGQG